MAYLLDTSIYSQPIKRVPIANVIGRWKEVGDDNCRISVFCELEILQGLAMAQSDRLRNLYGAVLKNRLPIISFTPVEAAIFARLQGKAIRSGNTRPVIDLCIAATALAHSLILVTLYPRDFSGIDDLSVESWG